MEISSSQRKSGNFAEDTTNEHDERHILVQERDNRTTAVTVVRFSNVKTTLLPPKLLEMGMPVQ
jgi:hypothetical protein